MATRQKSHWIDTLYGPGSKSRSHFQRKAWSVSSGFPGHLVELPYDLISCKADGSLLAWPPWPNSGALQQPDLGNVRGTYYATNNPPDSRLYAGVYNRFAEAARQGSAEVGMNLVTYKQALKTFCQVSLTALSAVRIFVDANRAGLALIKKRGWQDMSPAKIRSRQQYLSGIVAKDKAERLRIKNELFALQTVTGTFLAWRYGISPLMGDLSSAAQVLSGPCKDVVEIRRSNSTAVKSLYVYDQNTREDSYEWIETCTLRGTATVTNPNLGLFNRLGIINPQVWLWDATPWSFVIDWWFPIGKFLSNFTALVGLDLNGTSVTTTRRGTVTVRRDYTFGNGTRYNHYGTAKLIRKLRRTGSLPFPTAVPYGNGLGIERAQNALALIGQILSKKVK